MLRSPRPVLLAVVLSAVLAACAGASQPAGPPTQSADVAAVNDAMAAVATARQPVDADITAAVRVFGRVPSTMQSLRSPSEIDSTLDTVPALAADHAAIDVDGLATAVTELDQAIVAAVGTIDTALSATAEGSWEARYLLAQREVLGELGTWSGASRLVVEQLGVHAPLVGDFVSRAAVLAEDRWRYRSPEEAAATWEVESGPEVASLTAVTDGLEPLIASRDAAAAAVAAAGERADEVFASRPASP